MLTSSTITSLKTTLLGPKCKYQHLARTLKYHILFRMDLASTLGDLANRFTNTIQVEKLEKFVADTKLSESVKTRLTSAATRSKKNIDWDSKRLREMKTYFGKGKGGASQGQTLSMMVSVLVTMIYVLLN